MGELSGTFQDSPESKIDKDQAVAPPEGKVKTDVDGCFADAVNTRDNLPVFTVSHDEFNQNMNYGRQRIRFKSDSAAQKYMQGSRYKQSFWIQHADTKFMRKIK